MKRKILVFDLDGVLFDTLAIVEQAMIDSYPGLTKEMSRELLCGNYYEETEKLTIPKKSETEEEAAERKLLFSKKKAEALAYPGAKGLLEKLYREGYMLVLNTSAYERNCLPLLERADMAKLFDYLATAEVSKSKVEKFKVIQEKYEVNAEDTLFVTDTLGDLREADIAGVPTIAVTWGVHNRSYFTREEHPNLIAIVDSFDELMKVVQSR
jgi:phosphoglycolate phosphatase